MIAVVVVLLLAATFSACSYVVWHERDRLIKSAESGSTAAHVVILAANFWARYAVFFAIMGISIVLAASRILSRFR